MRSPDGDTTPIREVIMWYTWVSRTPSSFITEDLHANPPLYPAIIARSGRGGNDQQGNHTAIGEPAHVSLILYHGTPPAAGAIAPAAAIANAQENARWQTTDLNGSEGARVQIKISKILVGDLPKGSLFRGWQVTPANLANAVAEATTLANRSAADPEVDPNALTATYSHYGTGRSWNCAYYAERIIRAAQINVSAGRVFSSPLELTTGRSRIMRAIYERWYRGSGQPWYIDHGR
jgi:hypothetical protein